MRLVLEPFELWRTAPDQGSSGKSTVWGGQPGWPTAKQRWRESKCLIQINLGVGGSYQLILKTCLHKRYVNWLTFKQLMCVKYSGGGGHGHLGLFKAI